MTEPVSRRSPALSYAAQKDLTQRRTRSAVQIDVVLLRHEPLFRQLLASDEQAMRLTCEVWHIAPTTPRAYKPPVMVGQHALLAFPGAIIESIDEDEASRQVVRLLIKATDEGVIFHLMARMINGEVIWDWNSIELAPGHIREECFQRLLVRINRLVGIEIPLAIARANLSAFGV